MPGILITGANGFVGRSLCAQAQGHGHRVVAAVRSRSDVAGVAREERIVGDLAARPRLDEALAGIDCVVHLAGRAHIVKDRDPNKEDACWRSNVLATRHVAEQAVSAGVKRFVFLSSIKVYGDTSSQGPWVESDVPSPSDAYGRSKFAAEIALHDIAAASGLEVVVVRPPLVYGAGVKANFLSLMRAVARGLPLPLASIDNRRSLVSVWNLCDLIAHCIEMPRAANQTFLVSDGHDLSTPELIRALGCALGRPARLFPVPAGLIRATGRLLARSDVVERIIGSLQVDASKAGRVLGWTPTLSWEEGLARTARWYCDSTG